MTDTATLPIAKLGNITLQTKLGLPPEHRPSAPADAWLNVPVLGDGTLMAALNELNASATSGATSVLADAAEAFVKDNAVFAKLRQMQERLVAEEAAANAATTKATASAAAARDVLAGAGDPAKHEQTAIEAQQTAAIHTERARSLRNLLPELKTSSAAHLRAHLEAIRSEHLAEAQRELASVEVEFVELLSDGLHRYLCAKAGVNSLARPDGFLVRTGQRIDPVDETCRNHG